MKFGSAEFMVIKPQDVSIGMLTVAHVGEGGRSKIPKIMLANLMDGP